MNDAERKLKLRELFNRWTSCTLDLDVADKELAEMYGAHVTITGIDWSNGLVYTPASVNAIVPSTNVNNP